jgi:hypothetical protein
VTLSRPHLLWTKNGNAAPSSVHRAASVGSDSAIDVTPTEISRREAGSDRVLARAPLPPFLGSFVSAHRIEVFHDGARVAITFPIGVILTWSGAAEPQILARPPALTRSAGLLGDTLYLMTYDAGSTGAYDLAHLDPPLVTLPAGVALAAVRAENAGQDHWTCDLLSDLESLHEHWLAIAGKPSDPLWRCALRSLATTPRQEDGAVLRKLLSQKWDRGEKR